MNLVAQAEADLAFTLEDTESGFGIDFTIVDPEKNEYKLKGQTTDIGFFIDPNTGVGSNDRYAEINFRLSSFIAEGGTEYPEVNTGWYIKDVASNGIRSSENYSIQITPIDRKIGLMKIIARMVELTE